MQVGAFDAVVPLLRALQRNGMQPNKVTYCTIISMLGKQRRRGVRALQLAHELWRELLGSGIPLDDAAYRTGGWLGGRVGGCGCVWQRRAEGVGSGCL